METLGASWVVFGALFCMLVFGMVLKSGLGGFWDGFWLDFGGVGRHFRKVLGGGWERFWRILGDSGLFWAILGYWGGLGQSWEDFGWCCLLVGLLLRAIACYCSLLVAWAGFSLLWLPVAGFCLLAVPFVSFKLRVKGKNFGKPG